MSKILRKIITPATALFFLLNMSSAGVAATTVSAEVGFIFNTFLFLICGFLVMFMAAGFAMLESGMVTSKSVSVICAKNIGLFSIAGIMFWMLSLPRQASQRICVKNLDTQCILRGTVIFTQYAN